MVYNGVIPYVQTIQWLCMTEEGLTKNTVLCQLKRKKIKTQNNLRSSEPDLICTTDAVLAAACRRFEIHQRLQNAFDSYDVTKA